MSVYTVGMWLYQNGGGQNIQQTMQAKLRERNINTIVDLNLKDARSQQGKIVCNDTVMEELDLFFSYNAGQQTQYQVYLYQTLNRAIPMINNFDAFALTEDKYQTAHLLNRNGITTPDYHLIHKNDIDGLKLAIRQCGGKVVYKPTEGWGGVGIVKIDNEQALDMLLPFISKTDLRYFYVERFINYDNTDYRIDIVNGQYIGCYGRKAPKDDWKTNITSGGSIFVREPEPEVIELAKKAAAVTGLEIAGVDIIYDREREEYVVLEVNGIPAFATPEQEKIGLNFNNKKVDAIVDLIDSIVTKQTAIKAA